MKVIEYSLLVFDTVITVNIKTGKGILELYNKLNPKIQILAKSYFMDGQDHQDKVQDLQIKIYEIIPKFDVGKSSFYTFVCNCLGNYIKNQIRHNIRSRDKYIQNYESLTNSTIRQYDEKTARRR